MNAGRTDVPRASDDAAFAMDSDAKLSENIDDLNPSWVTWCIMTGTHVRLWRTATARSHSSIPYISISLILQMSPGRNPTAAKTVVDCRRTMLGDAVSATAVLRWMVRLSGCHLVEQPPGNIHEFVSTQLEALLRLLNVDTALARRTRQTHDGDPHDPGDRRRWQIAVRGRG